MVRFRTDPEINQRRNSFEQTVKIPKLTRNNAISSVLVLQRRAICFETNYQHFMICLYII